MHNGQGKGTTDGDLGSAAGANMLLRNFAPSGA